MASAPAARSARWIGLDLGGTKIFGVVLDGDDVVTTAKTKTPVTTDAADIVGAMASVVAELGGTDGVAGVGVGSPGGIDEAAGTVRQAGNIPALAGEVPLAPMLAEQVGVPVTLDNDVRVAVLAEHRLGAGRGHQNLLGIWWGTGVGGGLVLDGELRRGPAGIAGEIGHTVVHVGGRRCGCGKRGHVEAYAGRGAMEAEARARHAAGEKTALVRLAGDERMTAGVFAKALAEGDKVVTDLVDDAVRALGAAVASTVALLDLSLVIVGGGVGDKLGAPYCARIRESAERRVFPGVRTFDVVPGRFGDAAGAVGAALRARDAS